MITERCKTSPKRQTLTKKRHAATKHDSNNNDRIILCKKKKKKKVLNNISILSSSTVYHPNVYSLCGEINALLYIRITATITVTSVQ